MSVEGHSTTTKHNNHTHSMKTSILKHINEYLFFFFSIDILYICIGHGGGGVSVVYLVV